MANQNVDERIVEMRIDNDNFEKGAKQTISTLEKLERALHLKSDTSAMDEMSESVSKFKADPMVSGLEQIKSSFTALEIAGMRVISNLTDSVYNFATKTIKSFTVEPISQGFSKFGEKTTAVSTLTAQGYELEKVNKLMEDLNWFTDETSYNFTDMVGNIAKFTATGQDLDESVTAMEGIALWAALSGQNATKASMAMYQLSQAMGKGALKYDDYKSIQNASMDTQEFRNQAAEAAVELGYLRKTAEGVWETTEKTVKANQEFDLAGLFSSDALSRTSWFSSDVMMNVFNKYSRAVAAVQQYMEDHPVLETASKAMEALEEEASAKAIELGITIDEAFQRMGYDLDEFSLKALKAGQNARTWADVVDSVKDAVSTGWMTTFEKFFGDAETATSFWTELANQFYDIFAAGGERRNGILELALNGGKAEKQLEKSTLSLEEGWKKFQNRLESSGKTMDEFKDAVYQVSDRATIDMIENFNGIDEALQKGGISLDIFKAAWESLFGVEEEAAEESEKAANAAMGSLETMREVALGILRGDYGNGDERRELIEEMGYDYELMQAMAGDLDNLGYYISDEQLIQEMEKYYRYMNVGSRTGYESFTEMMAAASAASEEVNYATNSVENYYNAVTNGLAQSEEELAEGMTGGELFREGIVNILETINTIKDAIDGVKESVFGDEEKVASRLKSFLKVFWQITESVKNFVQGENLLGGLEAIFTVIFSLINGIGRVAGIAFKAIRAGLSIFRAGLDALTGLLAAIDKRGALKNFGLGLKNVFEALAVPLELIFNYVTDLFNRVRSSERFGSFIDKVAKKISILSIKFAYLTSQFKQFMQSDKIQNGITSFLGKVTRFASNIKNSLSSLNIIEKLQIIWQWIKNIFSSLNFDDFSISEAFSDVYDFFSPLLTVLFGNKEDLKKSAQEAFDAIIEGIQERWADLKERLSQLSFMDILKGMKMIAATAMLAKFAQLLGSLRQVADESKTILEGFKDIQGSIRRVFDSLSTSIKSNTIIKLAIALGILAMAMVALSIVPSEKLTHVATVVGLLMVLLVSLAKSMGTINKLTGDRISGNTLNLNIFNGLAAKLFGLALVMGVITAAIVSFKKNKITFQDAEVVLAAIGILMIMFIGFSASMKRIAQNNPGNAWSNAAMLLAMVVAIRMMIKPIKQLAEIQKSELELKRGIAALALLMGLITAMVGIIAIIEGSGIMKREGSTFKKFGGTGANFLKIAAGLLVMALAINALLFPIRKLSELWAEDNGNKLWGGLGALAALLVILGLFAGLLGNIGAKNNSGGNFLKVAAGLLVLALAIDILVIGLAAFTAVVLAVATQIPWESLDKRMVALHKALTPLGELAIILIGFGIAMVGMGIGAAALGLGLLACTLGFLVFSVALLALAKGIDVIVEAFPKFINGLADVGKTIQERKGELIAGALLLGALVVVLFLFSKSLKNIFGGKQYGKAFGNLITSIVAGLGNLFARMGTKMVEQLPTILSLMGMIAVMIGLYMLDVIPDLVEVAVNAVIIFFSSLADSINAHQDELVESITSIISSVLSVIRGILEGFWDDATFTEKIVTVAAGFALVASKVVDFGLKLGGSGGKGGLVHKLEEVYGPMNNLSDVTTGVQMSIGTASDAIIASLGSVCSWFLILAAAAGYAYAGISSQEKLFREEAFEGLGDSRDDYLIAYERELAEIARVQKDYDNLAFHGADLTMVDEELTVRQTELAKLTAKFEKLYGLPIDEYAAKVEALNKAYEDYATYEGNDKVKASRYDAYRRLYEELNGSSEQLEAQLSQTSEALDEVATQSGAVVETSAQSTDEILANAHEELEGYKTKLTENLSSLAATAQSELGNFVTTVTDDMDLAELGVDDGANNIVNNVIGMASELPGDAENYNGMYSSGAYTMSGFRDGAAVVWNQVASMMSGWGSSVAGFFNVPLRVASPSKVMMETGKFTMLGLMLGMEEHANDVFGTAEGIATDLVSTISETMAQVGLIADDDFNFSPRISPVVDMTSISGAAGQLSSIFGASDALMGIGRVSASRVENLQMSYSPDNRDIVSELRAMNERINNLGNAITNMQIVLDSGTLVGATSAQMDNQLGIRAMRKGRGN